MDVLFPPVPPRPMTESEYLRLDTPRLVEFIDGVAEEFPPGTESHQGTAGEVAFALSAWVRPRGLGRPLFAPLPVRVAAGRYREPDVLFMLTANYGRRHERFWDGADLVMEVVSEDRRQRDLVDKRADYAAAGIPEYWIIDPLYRTITVLTLAGGTYAEAGAYAAGQRAPSVLLNGFEVSVDDVFNAR